MRPWPSHGVGSRPRERLGDRKGCHEDPVFSEVVAIALWEGSSQAAEQRSGGVVRVLLGQRPLPTLCCPGPASGSAPSAHLDSAPIRGFHCCPLPPRWREGSSDPTFRLPTCPRTSSQVLAPAPFTAAPIGRCFIIVTMDVVAY